MKALQTIGSVLLVSLLILSAATVHAAEKSRAIYVQITLGKNQTGHVLEYTRASMNDRGQIMYDARIDGMSRTVVYTLDKTTPKLTIAVNGGAAPLEYIVGIKSPRDAASGLSLSLVYNGNQIGSAEQQKPDENVVIRIPENSDVDRYSMDVLLQLPTEFAGIRPQDLFGDNDNTGGSETAAKGIFKKLWKLLTGGLKYDHDCETTKTGPIYKCDTPCTQSANSDPGKCDCGMCGPICCSGGCTITEGTTQRNCSASVSIGS